MPGNISAVEGTKVILGYEFSYNTKLPHFITSKQNGRHEHLCYSGVSLLSMLLQISLALN